MLETLHVSMNLHQQLNSLIPSDFIPDDADPNFSQCLNSVENPSDTRRETVPEVLGHMFAADDASSAQLLHVLIDQVLLFQSSSSFKGSDLRFRRRGPVQLTWSMCAGSQKWSAVHNECIMIDEKGSGQWPGDVHCVCGRAFTRFIVDRSEVDSENSPIILPPEEERKDQISKDVGMLFSQVAATVKFTNDITNHEAFLWGMCDTNFYLVRGYFPASYIEAVERLSGPLPALVSAQVDRTIFLDMNTPDGFREAIRGIVALLRYLEWRYKGDHKSV